MQTMQSKHFFQTACLCLMLSAVGACAVPQYPVENKALTAGMIADSEREALYRIDEEWWQAYGDERLNALIAQALANNIDLKKAALSVNKTLYQANILGAGLVPSVNASLGASVSHHLDNGTESKNFSSQLGLSYELDLWRKLRMKTDAQVWEVQAGGQDLAEARLALVNNVADAYWNIAYLNEALTAARKEAAHHRQILGIAQSKYRHGKTSSASAVQAEQALLGAQNTVLSLSNSRDSVLTVLRNLLNLKPNEPLAADPEYFRLTEPAGVDLDVPLNVLGNRPDVRAAEYRLNAASAGWEAQKRNWYPGISLGLSLSSASDKAKTMFDVPLLGGTVKVSLPFLDWKTLKWESKTAEANFDTARLNFEKTLTAALNEVDGYYVKYRYARTVLQQAEQRYRLDKENSRYYEARYRHGKAELKDRLSALNSEYAAQQNLLSRRYELLKQESMVYKAMAGRYRHRAEQP